MNILHLTPDFNYTDGRSYYVYLILKYLKRAGHKVFLCTNGGDSLDRLSDTGIPFFVNTDLSKKPAFPKSLKYISKLISDNDINIIHSYHRYYELLSGSLSGKRNYRTVFTALSIVSRRFFIEYKSDCIIAVSECVKEMLTDKFNVDKNKITLIPNFVDNEESSNINRESSIENREASAVNKVTNVLYIGRFHREKNLETLIKAVSLIKEHEIQLTLIGEGEEKQKYENLISKTRINAKFISPRKDLKQFYEAADICVLSSIRDPLPGFMLQSGLFNKPFIGSDVDGIAEVIEDNVNGLLFEKKNEFQLSEKIKMFMHNKEFAKKCADNLNKLIMKKFTEKSIIPQIEKLYEGLLNNFKQS